MPKITFIRHCQCYNLNTDGSMNYMRVNPPLTSQGIEKAKTLKGTYDHVIISPMTRCIETFIYSNIQATTREIREEFRELILCPGDFRQNDPAEITAETPEMFQKRVKKALAYLKTFSEEDRICVVTHSEWIKEVLDLNYIPDYGEEIINDC